jgi:uncharacterized protein (DUF2249 family)
VIRADECVADVLRRDERLIDVFVHASPAFERLRNPLLRRTMARLVTVEQAARIGGVAPELLLHRLNREVGYAAEAAMEPATGSATPTYRDEDPTMTLASPAAMPLALQSLAADRLVDVDVRDDLRAGREPFSRIMAARRALPAGHVLRLRAIFEPAPLYQVMAKQGLDHWTERLADDDWRVWFFASDEASARISDEPASCGGCGPMRPAEPTAEAEVPAPPADDVTVLDVRGLEPPEPMVRTLAALRELPPGGTLVQLNVRVPQFLLPQLEEQGFTWEIREQSDDLVRLFIRRR